MENKPNRLERINDHSFLYVGKWDFDKEGKINYNLPKEIEEQECVLYAFVVGDEVKYIGKTENSLKERMDGYRYGGDDSTNERINKEIKKILNKREKVSIYILSDFSKFSEHNLPNDELIVPLEGALIDMLKLKEYGWNKQGGGND